MSKPKIHIKSLKKKDYQLAAEVKTISDYALVLEHLNGYSRTEAQKLAAESHGEPLFKALLKRNVELFVTGDIIMFGQ